MRKIFLPAACVLFAAAAISFHGGNARQFDEEAISSILRDGDIICRLGGRIWSSFFKDVSPKCKQYSHVGIVSKREGRFAVIHAEEDKVKETPLRDFLDIAVSVGVYRAKDADGSLLASKAAELKGRPFDWDFDLADESKVYCTELIYIAMKQANPKIELTLLMHKGMNRLVIPPDSCHAPEYFSKIVHIEKGN
jgi:hypothetical protein